jgi:Ni/Fe-hydrogenase 1 B-type cytochrome subunit
MTIRPSATVYRRVYVWELPVRFYHWINAVCILLLGITGYIIGRPVSITYMPEAYQQSWFGTVRMVHFVTAYVFVFTFAFRIYWGFVGNHYARWHQFIPYTKKQWSEIMEVLRVDILQTHIRGPISIGHNMLAGFVYFMTFFVFLFQVVTGFGLYAAMSDSWMAQLFAWVPAMMGGDMAVRNWHHIMLWFYVVFFVIHVYLVFYHDYVEGRGTTSSMVGGWKFERDEDIEHG